jgi:hypothetical protein
MRYSTIAVVCLSAIGMLGCGMVSPQQVATEPSGMGGTVKLGLSRLDTIEYCWESSHVNFVFVQTDLDSEWEISIRDQREVSDIAVELESNGKVWGPSQSRCATGGLLTMLERSLVRFHAEKPDARFYCLSLEMHIEKSLWERILRRLSKTMAGLDQVLPEDDTERSGDEFAGLNEAIAESPTAKGIADVLRSHGMTVSTAHAQWMGPFRGSLVGRKYADIATMPGVGVRVPGTVEFDLGGSRLRAVSADPNVTDTGRKGS